MHSDLQGDGGPQVNPDFAGGVSPIDPQVTLPAGGHYQEFTQIDQPYSRYTNLVSADLSFNAGFATVSSTSSYFSTTGRTLQDDTYDLAGIDSGAFLSYYAGSPTNPRFVYDYLFADHTHTFTEEVRLVSNSHPDNMFDYVLGVFYEKQESTGAWTIAIPGSPVYKKPTLGLDQLPGQAFHRIDRQDPRAAGGRRLFHASIQWQGKETTPSEAVWDIDSKANAKGSVAIILHGLKKALALRANGARGRHFKQKGTKEPKRSKLSLPKELCFLGAREVENFRA